MGKNIDKLLSTPITIENIEDILRLMRNKSRVKFALFCVGKVVHLTAFPDAQSVIEALELWLKGDATARECMDAATSYYNAFAKGILSEASNADDVVYCAGYSACTTNGAAAYNAYHFALLEIEDRNEAELFKAEVVAYLKELIIKELPKDLREDWLLVASV